MKDVGKGKVSQTAREDVFLSSLHDNCYQVPGGMYYRYFHAVTDCTYNKRKRVELVIVKEEEEVVDVAYFTGK